MCLRYGTIKFIMLVFVSLQVACFRNEHQSLYVGFGRNSIGGKGGRVIQVTSLADNGPGSLREAITTSGPRTIKFAVGGVIVLQSPLIITSPNLTIDGSSAPEPGVQLSNSGGFDGPLIGIRTDEIIINYLRIRPGPGPKGSINNDGIEMWTGRNIVIDHCSIMWASDENITGWGPVKNVTVQNSIIAEGLHHSVHLKGPHSKGSLWGNGAGSITLWRNLFAHNDERNPWVKAVEEKGTAETSFFQVVNNLIYNWGEAAIMVGSPSWLRGDGLTAVDIIGNYLKEGKNSTRYFPIRLEGDNVKVYLDGNSRGERSISGNDMGVFTNSKGWIPDGVRASTEQLSLKPVTSLDLPIIAAASLEKTLIGSVGASLPLRDSVDRRIIEEFQRGAGHLIDYPLERNRD